MRFEGKTCVVTGGANGIGKCIAEAFLREGARVAVIDKDEPAGKKMAQNHKKLLFMHGDAAEKETLEVFAQQVMDTFCKLDCLVNNACINNKGLLSGCSYEDFDHALRAGVVAPYYLALLFKESFTQGASIVNISSTRAVMSQPDTESYTAAKGGISALTHALCMSFSGRVRVNAISPGWIDTRAYQHKESHMPQHTEADARQHPCGRIGSSEDIANTVLYLCSTDAGFINGENISIDGGMTRRMIYHGDDGWSYDGS